MERRAPRPYLVPQPTVVAGSPPVPPVGDRWGGGYRDRMDEVLDRAERVRAEMAGVRATATAGNGAVVATVDGSGVLTGLRFGPRADDLDRDRLAELVLAAVADAASSASRRVIGMVEELSEGARRA